MRGFPISILLALVGLAGCGQSSTTPSAVTDASKMPADQIVYGLHHVMTKNGVRSAILDGDTAYLQEEGQRFDLVGVRLQFFAESGRETGTLTSKTGEYDVNQGFFTARGDVVLITQGPKGPRRLETEELYYNVKGDQLWSDRPFVMHEGGSVTRGSSFQSDAKGTTWTARGLRTEGVETGSSGLSF